MQMTTENRRDSLLELFDPLANAGPRTPPRPTGCESPDSSVGSCSDKENDNPTPGHHGPMTEFFMRVYKDPQHSQPTQPQSPPGKLIDLSMSMEADDIENKAGDEEEEGMEGVENVGGCISADDSTAEYLQEMRMPLAELQLDDVPPVVKPTGSNMDVDSVSSHLNANTKSRSPQAEHCHSLTSVLTAPAPLGTPLADVINSINYGSSPSIHICPPDEDIVFEPEYESPLGFRNGYSAASQGSHLSPDSSLPSLLSDENLRREITTGSGDPRRISCDLQTSFSLVMQSTEMSFDLLNDKIPFFGQGQQQESSWPGEHEDDGFDCSKDATGASGAADSSMLKAEDTSMEDDTFDFTKEKQKMDELTDMYGSIHGEQLKVAEKAAAAAVANSPRQRSIHGVPLPKFTLSPRPSPLIEELLAAKNEDISGDQQMDPTHIEVPNIFTQFSIVPAEEENQENQDANEPEPAKPRRFSITASSALSRRPSIPALAFSKKTMEPEREREQTTSSTSTSSSVNTTASTSRTSLARKGPLSSNKVSADNTRSTPSVSLARRGSLSAIKASSLAKQSSLSSRKAEPVRSSTSANNTSSADSTSRNVLGRRASVFGLKAVVDSARSTSSTAANLIRRGSVSGLKAASATRSSISTTSKSTQPMKGVQRPPTGAAVPPSSSRLALQRTSAIGQKTAPSTARVASTSAAQRPATTKSTISRAISTTLSRSTASTASTPAPKAGALRVPTRTSASTSNSTSNGPPARSALPRLPSKLPGVTARSLSMSTKSSTLPRKP